MRAEVLLPTLRGLFRHPLGNRGPLKRLLGKLWGNRNSLQKLLWRAVYYTTIRSGSRFSLIRSRAEARRANRDSLVESTVHKARHKIISKGQITSETWRLNRYAFSMARWDWHWCSKMRLKRSESIEKENISCGEKKKLEINSQVYLVPNWQLVVTSECNATGKSLRIWFCCHPENVEFACSVRSCLHTRCMPNYLYLMRC